MPYHFDKTYVVIAAPIPNNPNSAMFTPNVPESLVTPKTSPYETVAQVSLQQNNMATFSVTRYHVEL